MRRVPCSHSSTSALLLSPLIYRGSAPGYSARICQSSSAIRCILKVTRGFAIASTMRRPAQAASPKSQALIGAALFNLVQLSAVRLLIDRPGVGDDPTQGLLFRSKAVDAAFVAFVVPDDDVPPGARFVGKGEHHGLFFFGVGHCGRICPVRRTWQAFAPALSGRRREIWIKRAANRNKV